MATAPSAVGAEEGNTWGPTKFPQRRVGGVVAFFRMVSFVEWDLREKNIRAKNKAQRGAQQNQL